MKIHNTVSILVVSFMMLECTAFPFKKKEPPGVAYDALAAAGYLIPVSCRKAYGQWNALFGIPEYHRKISSVTDHKNLVILGDSTMDTSCRLDNWASPDTHCAPVAGNTMCDMIEQLPSIRVRSPKVIMIATTGGNDILAGLDPDIIINTGKLLVSSVAARWPDSKIILIPVHPTKVAVANKRKDIVNLGIMEHAEYLGDRFCTIDITKIFGNTPPTERMLDDIHYDAVAAFLLKTEVFSKCGVSI